MPEPKSHFQSVGLDDEGTARGLVLRDVVTDLAMMWPKYTRIGLLGHGREWKVCAASPGLNGTITVVGGAQSGGNANAFVDVGDELNLTRVKGSDQFTSTPLTVTAVVSAYNATNGRYEVTFTFSGTVPSVALDGYDFLNTERTQAAAFQTWSIQSHTTGANSNVVITHPAGQLGAVPDTALCDCDVFQCGDLVKIAASGDSGKNDGLFECRANFTDGGATATIHLDGYLNTIVSGGLGTITQLLPMPLRVIGTTRAVCRAHDLALQRGNLVRVRRVDERHDFWEIMTVADLGPPQWFDPVTP